MLLTCCESNATDHHGQPIIIHPSAPVSPNGDRATADRLSSLAAIPENKRAGEDCDTHRAQISVCHLLVSNEQGVQASRYSYRICYDFMLHVYISIYIILARRCGALPLLVLKIVIQIVPCSV